MAQRLSVRILYNSIVAGVGATLKAALYNGGTINPDADYMADVDGTEIATTTGYTNGYAGRLALDNVTVTPDETNDRVKIDCDDENVAALGVPAGISATKLVIYKPVTSDADSPVIGQYELNGGSVATLDGAYTTFQIHADGLAVVTV